MDDRSRGNGGHAASDITGQVKEKATALAGKARDTAEEQKDYGAEQLGGLARAVHGAASELEERMPQAARYVHQAADRLEDFSSSLRDRSLDDVFHQVKAFARERPAVVFGGALLIGLIATRFLKASGSAAQHTTHS